MLPEGQQLSHYQLVRLLKSGGMGEVYLAVDTLLHRQVAIKVIHTDTLRYAETDVAKDAARLFLREAQAIAQLDQTNILPLYDSGEQRVDGTALMYMVMPYRQAGSLADWKRTRFGEQLLPLAAVERIVRQAAFALQHAHDRHIIHQDVKPSNFLVHGDADHPSRLHLQLADFGVARFTMMTSESQVIRGTPTYMAPEQWDGHPVPATDQYALAVMAYELLTGSPPFVGNGYQQLWHQHSHLPPTPPSMLNPTVPQELDAVFLRALEKNPERRFSSVSAFAHAFQRAVLNSGNVHQTLTITALEARTGTNRLLPQPGGRQVMVTIPPGVIHGQVIRLEGFGRPTTYNNPVGALIVTIIIAPVVAQEVVSPMSATFQHTVPVGTSLARNEARPALLPVPLKKRHVKSGSLLKIGFALVVLMASISLCYLAGSFAVNHGQIYDPVVTVTATSDMVNGYPKYLPGKGTLALDDPMKDDSKGYVWNPPHYEYCYFLRGSLHVWVYGDDTNLVHFRPCMGMTPNFGDFAYQIKMTFIEGGCGGVVFRSHEPKLYYFYICQDGTYGLVRYTKNVSDPSVNPTLKSGHSPYIIPGSNKVNIIAVVAQGSNIDLYVNQHHIDGTQDTSYSDGTIGVLARILVAGRSEVAFSDATVWTL